jgi:succinylglutamic semialdehyde dehydrogenase
MRGSYIDGAWQAVARPDGEIVRKNPARLSEEVSRAAWAVGEVDAAVDAAWRARRAWDRVGAEGRRALVQRLGEEIGARKEALARQIALEAGKPLWEAATEVGAMVNKIAIMTGIGAQFTADWTPDGVPGELVWRPLGVAAVLGPFNFPLHLPHGHMVPALLMGDTVVFKPSECAPGCAELYMECVDAAGFPAGVVNMVQGPGPVGAALVADPRVGAVMFTGSYATGLRIKQATLEQPHKLLALELGGKNTTIILDDANLDQAVHEVAQAAFLTCGQRCSATSRVVVAAGLEQAFTERFLEVASRITTGDTLTEQVFMGPLIHEAAYAKFLESQADDEGGALTPLLRGGATREELGGCFVTPGVWRASALNAYGSHQAEEIFGPDVVIYAAGSEAEAATIANATDYGLAMSVFTASRERFEGMAWELESGLINWNRSTAGASSALPFGGVKRSGNHRASAVLAGQYSGYPQARLLNEAGWSEAQAGAAPFKYLRGR